MARAATYVDAENRPMPWCSPAMLGMSSANQQRAWPEGGIERPFGLTGPRHVQPPWQGQAQGSEILSVCHDLSSDRTGASCFLKTAAGFPPRKRAVKGVLSTKRPDGDHPGALIEGEIYDLRRVVVGALAVVLPATSLSLYEAVTPPACVAQACPLEVMTEAPTVVCAPFPEASTANRLIF